MDKKDVVRTLGFPDKIIPKGESILNRVPKIWKCSRCGYVQPTAVFLRDIRTCACGSVFWEA